MKTTYYYIVDLDERGTYKAHVENADTGKTVFEISNEDEDGNIEPLRIIEDGFMKHNADMSGLIEYLIDMSILEEDDKIVYKG